MNGCRDLWVFECVIPHNHRICTHIDKRQASAWVEDAFEIVVFNEDSGILIIEFIVDLDHALSCPQWLIDKAVPPENNGRHERRVRIICWQIKRYVTQLFQGVDKGVILIKKSEESYGWAFLKVSDLITLSDTYIVIWPMKVSELVVDEGYILSWR